MTERGKKVAEKAVKDPKVVKALEGVETKAEAIKILNKLGYECSLEDFANPVAKNGKVSLDEAKAVAGGTTCACVVGGGGTDTCYCVFGGGGRPDGVTKDTPCVCVIGGGGEW